MKLVYRALIAIIIILFQSCHENKNLDEKYGFRDVEFEVDISKYSDLKLVNGNGNKKMYIRSSDKLKVGKAELHTLVYIFYKDKLHSVALGTKGIDNTDALLNALKTQYGEEDEHGPTLSGESLAERFSWTGSKIKLVFNKEFESHDGIALFTSIPMNLKEIKDTDKETADDL